MTFSAQVQDANGQVIASSNNGALITSATTTTIAATGTTLLLTGVVIFKDVDGGTFYFTDGAGNSIAGLPSSGNAGVTDYPGSFPIPKLYLSNGLKIVTASTTGIVMAVYWFE